MSSEPAVQKGSLILVTGANGYIGSHVANQLLLHGYKVRGTARSTEKCEMTNKLFTEKYGAGKYESAVVEDFATNDAFHEVMEGCAGVVHVASDLTFSEDPNTVVTLTVKGANNVMQAALKHSSVQQVVYTSSSAAMVTPRPEFKFNFGTERWNDEAVDIAWGKKPSPDPALYRVYVYGASKTEAERACWAFMKEHKPHFVFNTVNPNFNVGTILHPDQRGSSAGLVRGLYHNSEEATQMFKMLGPQYHINVEDTARLHVAPFLFPDIQNKRLLGFNDRFNYNKVLDILEKISPGRQLPAHEENPWNDGTTPDTSYSVEVLKRMGRPGFTSLEQSIRDTIGATS